MATLIILVISTLCTGFVYCTKIVLEYERNKWIQKYCKIVFYVSAVIVMILCFFTLYLIRYKPEVLLTW